jgi:hypothetical protein
MTHPHDRALEAAARAAMNAWEASPDCPGKMYGQEAEVVARAAVNAYLAEAGDGRLAELERENAALREALIIYFTQPSSPRHDEAFNTLAIFATSRAALAGSGEK